MDKHTSNMAPSFQFWVGEGLSNSFTAMGCRGHIFQRHAALLSSPFSWNFLSSSAGQRVVFCWRIAELTWTNALRRTHQRSQGCEIHAFWRLAKKLRRVNRTLGGWVTLNSDDYMECKSINFEWLLPRLRGGVSHCCDHFVRMDDAGLNASVMGKEPSSGILEVCNLNDPARDNHNFRDPKWSKECLNLFWLPCWELAYPLPRHILDDVPFPGGIC